MVFGVLFITISLFTTFAFAQEHKILVLRADISPDSSINSFLQILEDKNAIFTPDSIFKHNGFSKLDSNKELNKTSVYWSKLIVQSEFKYPAELIIQIGNKRSSDFAEMYFANEKDSVLKISRSGFFENKENKEIKQEIGSKFILHLEPGKLYHIYFKIRNISGFKPDFDLKVYAKEYFNSRLIRRNLVQGMLQGALWMIFLYNLFIFFFSRDKVYLFYSLYIIFIALNFVIERGLFVEYTIWWFPKLDPYFFIAATGLASVAYFQFIRFFLDTRKNMPVWDRAHLWVIRINLFVTGILLLVLLINYNIPISINISNYINLAGILYGFVFIFYLIKSYHRLSRFFIAGALALATGTGISLYFLVTKSTLDFDPKYFMNGGTIIELLIFSLGLGARIRLIEESKQAMQLELIEQLRQNDSLKENANRELEIKVKERTVEIEQQKEEILTQSESLKAVNEFLTKQKREIEHKNEEIIHQQRILERIHQNTTDSIHYASRIQNVILPSETILAKYFDSHFIYYQPKEIVSGDFYWYRYLEKDNRRYFAIAVADSTGHGVPGSLLSMLGISLLNETVIRNEINTANQVLETLRNQIKTTFSYSDEQLLTRDGIDMAFCIIDLDNQTMQYSGANRPLLIFKNNPEKGTDPEIKPLIEIKPNKNPVGMHHKQTPFDLHTIQLEKGDVIYLFSDGFADQVGGSDGRKFYMKRFKELLASVYLQPLLKQKQIIDETYKAWTNHQFNNSQNFKQVDDMLVMGLRI